MKLTRIKKSEIVIAQIMLVFLGIAFHSLLVFSPVVGFLSGTNTNIISIEFLVVYAVLMVTYSMVTSLYVMPTMIISPYYIQVGTSSTAIFIVIYHVITKSAEILQLAPQLLLLFLIFSLFTIGGYGLTKALRWLFGMSVEPDNNWLKTYRIDVEYVLAKRVFDDVLFKTYDKKMISTNSMTVTKKFSSGIKILILLKSDPKSPTESILSITSCEIEFESIWKTDEALKILNSMRNNITGWLTTNYSSKLIEDENEKQVSSECELYLLESFNSPLSRLGKISRKTIFAVGGLLSIALGVTILSLIPEIQQKIQLDTSTIILTWVTMISTALLLNSSGIKTTLEKIQKHT